MTGFILSCFFFCNMIFFSCGFSYRITGLVDPQLALTPLGSFANFTCTAPSSGSFLRWDVMLVGVEATLRLPGDGFDQTMLDSRGIYAISNGSRSVLYVSATATNNGTRASCVFASLDTSAWVTVIAYG